jgi:hypothetical protein
MRGGAATSSAHEGNFSATDLQYRATAGPGGILEVRIAAGVDEGATTDNVARGTDAFGLSSLRQLVHTFFGPL